MTYGYNPHCKIQYQRQDFRRWITTYPSTRTQLNVSLRPVPLWTHGWRRSGFWGQELQAVVGAGPIGCGGDADGVSGGVTDRGGGGDGYGQSWWEDNVAHVTLDTETNDPLFYSP